ncbi:MAG: hypothetical protein HUU54_06390 [Ignavibacteriaceae bacterium]|nr:hypothetical protein [Ignavibacteriaceae bacterium]
MDNLLDIIIFLVIIYGFLSPFFKKKKEQSELPDQDVYFPEEEDKPKQRRDYSNYSEKDVLEEIENLFRKTNLPQPDRETPVRYDEAKYSPEHLPVEKYTAEEKTSRSVFKQPPMVIPPLVEVKIPDRPVLVNESALRVRRLIKDSATLRDAIIISEILNRRKPGRR